MLFIDCFGHNIYVNKQLIGYIGENELIISGRKFADFSDDGIISINNKEVGYIDDDGSIIIRDKEVGYVDGNNDFVFFETWAKM